MSPALPVEACLDEVRRALAEHGHAVLQAPPGAGKTTIVPLRLLHEPWLGRQRIVVLEPRRLATRAAAHRMASLLGENVGETVGYRTRDERRSSPATRIEVVTEGILTRRLQRDPELPGVGLVIFDEFHERNLQSDLGLALALESRANLRPDLRILVMSATLDAKPVAALLGQAPVVTSEGRAHPVDVRWQPRPERVRVEDAAADAVRRALREHTGDVLVFLPGAGEIARTADRLFDVATGGVVSGGGVELHALHGSLPIAEQDAALAPAATGRRKVVLATDIAETSLTVEGVRIVVDSGLCRRPRFDPRTGMTRLLLTPISRASADQRAGRAGRLGPGVAIRLWSKIEHGARRAFTDPEIVQVDLAGLALELAAWGTPDPRALGFLDQPPARVLAEGRELCRELGALDRDDRLTSLGLGMAGLPLHPRLAAMVLRGRESGDAWLACVIAALVDERDVLRGRSDELPSDLDTRVRLVVEPGAHHALADTRAVRRVRQSADDLARRVGATPDRVGPAELDRIGVLVASAYPDRIAQARGGARATGPHASSGSYQLRTGAGAWLPANDPLARQPYLVAAELDGDRKNARIRLAAGISPDDIDRLFRDQVDEDASLLWDKERDDLVVRAERRLGRIRLGITSSRPQPGPDTERALLDRVRATKLAVLPPSLAAAELRERVAFVSAHGGDGWPDLSDRALLRSLDRWLAPFLAGATGRDALDTLDLARALSTLLDHDQRRELERLAPPHLVLPTGRKVRIDYGHDAPTISVRAQELFGTTTHPTVLAGEVPVVVHVLSPADRPIQITSDLPGFWRGSWADVRKDLAGRYPKHDWPLDPTAVAPRRRAE